MTIISMWFCIATWFCSYLNGDIIISQIYIDAISAHFAGMNSAKVVKLMITSVFNSLHFTRVKVILLSLSFAKIA